MKRVLNISVALLAIFSCYLLARNSVIMGVGRSFVALSILQQRVEPADRSVAVSPSDPETHYTRALMLVNAGRLDEAVVELDQATRLRPHHYYEWLDLGVTLERLGDQKRAELALRESVRLAPSFSQPRWQLGSLLFRQGRYDEAFNELRVGAASNPKLGPELFDLAWVAGEANTPTVEALIKPQTRRSRLHFAVFLAKHGSGSDAARYVSYVGEPVDDPERALERLTISQLLASGQFEDAFKAWSSANRQSAATEPKDQFLNGDFNQPIKTGDVGFGWQLTSVPNVTASIDTAGPAPGTRSLSLEFAGEVAPESEPVHQLVLVQPGSRYTLTFAARTRDIVSGGMPVITVQDVDGKVTKKIAQSNALSSALSEWNTYQVDFLTAQSTFAVVIGTQRLPCSQSACPIFGRLWLSRFALKRN